MWSSEGLCVELCEGFFGLIAIKRIWPWLGPMASYCIKTSCGHVCGGLRECVWVFQALLGVCGCVWGFSAWSQSSGFGRGLVLWHCIASKHHVGMSVEVCGCVCGCFWHFWECVGVFSLIAIKRIWPWFGPMASYCIQTSCGHVCGSLRVCVSALSMFGT